MAFTSLLAAWRPAVYHGFGRRRNYFEGWYFKLINAEEDRAFAVIPGVFLGKNAADSYAFVQTLDGSTGRSTFHRYPLAEFAAAHSEFHVRIGPNCFRADRLCLDLDFPDRRMKGELRFSGMTPWPVTLTSPGIMGWYAFVPFMECYHGVVSFDHAIAGQLGVDGDHVDFTGGRGYIEKDWGRSFPRAWVWMQSNHFATPGTCLTASVATIPWLGTAFRGFIAGLWHEGRLYRFATYTGAQIELLTIEDRRVMWQMAGPGTGRSDRRKRYRLRILAERAEGGLLHGPFRTAMFERVAESLTATVKVELCRVDPGGAERVLFRETGRRSGLEINGELAEILDESK